MTSSKKQLFRHASLVIVAVGFLGGSIEAQSKLYRYVQDDGTIVYGDRAPDSVDSKGHTIMSKRGVAVRDVLSRDEQDAARELERQAALRKIHDRALLATFTNEEDLTRTRDDRIGMIDGLIGRLDDRIRILSERLTVVEDRIDVQERLHGDGLAPESLYTELKSIQRNIENAWALIDTKAAERNVVADKFKVDLERYRELKTDNNRY